jgi:hypothetical protein
MITTKLTLVSAGLLVSVGLTACGGSDGGHNASYQNGYDYGSGVTYADVVDAEQMCGIAAAGLLAADSPDKDSYAKGCMDGMHDAQSQSE